MIVFKRAADIREYLEISGKNGKRVGFVPTMGALHEGHISLIKQSKSENDLSVCSIFVNPTQFNDPADFEKYPVTISQDITLLEENGNDILFLPGVKDMYPDGVKSKSFHLGDLDNLLEGKFRPGHFNGVCTVVEKLLEIVYPDNLYLGQKDYQQCMVIRKMIELTGLDKKVNLRIAPTLRESNGLAMSSRNMRLSREEKIKASTIFKTLSYIKENLRKQKLSELKDDGLKFLSAEGFRPEYLEIADATNLTPVQDWNGKQLTVVLFAGFLGDVRLIDNLLLN